MNAGISYEPRLGPRRAHQIAMGTRIVYLFIFVCFLLYCAHDYSAASLTCASLFWTGLMLAFEWRGSFLIRWPVHQILIGRHIERGTCDLTCCSPLGGRQ